MEIQQFKPILFSTPMVQAILKGRKTKTRRIVKSKHESGLFEICRNKDGEITEVTSLDWDERPKNDTTNDIKPLGKVGDVLWVRETWNDGWKFFGDKSSKYNYKADSPDLKVKWKPCIHMPKKACRSFLEVTNIGIERLQDISEEDAVSEGVLTNGSVKDEWYNYLLASRNEFDNFPCFSAKESFSTLWELINGKGSWDENAYVWVIEFKVIDKPVNFK